MKVVAILASHNRRASTLDCLASWFGQATPPGISVGAVLVDDGSDDGTERYVRERFPEVEVLSGDGTLYWAGAMAMAERVAVAQRPDCITWLNDDVVLDSDALARLLSALEEAGGSCIAVGALRDPVTGQLTYSGVKRVGWHPLRVELVPPAGGLVEVETFNGNVVVVPRNVAQVVGEIDGGFAHAAADFDYGLRAGKLGVVAVVVPGTVGTCAREERPVPWLTRDRPLSARFRSLLGPKGFPPRSTARYLRRHGGGAWPVFWLMPYAKAAAVSLGHFVRDPRSRRSLR